MYIEDNQHCKVVVPNQNVQVFGCIGQLFDHVEMVLKLASAGDLAEMMRLIDKEGRRATAFERVFQRATKSGGVGLGVDDDAPFLAGIESLPAQIEFALDKNFAQRFQGSLELLLEVIIAMRRRRSRDSGDGESSAIQLKPRQQVSGDLSH